MATPSATLALAVVEFLKSRGEDDACSAEVCEQFGISDSDNNLGWFVGSLRREGFLVQIESATLFILPDAPIRTGYWVRHPTHGVVKVSWAVAGYPLVKVRNLGLANELLAEIKVRREDLRGV